MPHVLPGTIPAINTETGVKLMVRPDMLEMPNNALKLRSITMAEFYATDNAPAPVLKVEEPKVPDSKTSESSVIMTSQGTPFQSESVARATMTRKGLALEDYMILPVDGGFVITRI